MHPKETLFLMRRHMWTWSAFHGLCTQRSRVISADTVRGGVISSARLAPVAAHNICGCCLQLFRAGCVHRQSLQPGHDERVPPLSPPLSPSRFRVRRVVLSEMGFSCPLLLYRAWICTVDARLFASTTLSIILSPLSSTRRFLPQDPRWLEVLCSWHHSLYTRDTLVLEKPSRLTVSEMLQPARRAPTIIPRSKSLKSGDFPMWHRSVRQGPRTHSLSATSKPKS